MEARPEKCSRSSSASTRPTWGTYYNLALILRSLSIASDASGRPAGAETTRRSAREIEERLIRERPESSEYYYDVAQSYLSCSTTLVPTAERRR